MAHPPSPPSRPRDTAGPGTDPRLSRTLPVAALAAFATVAGVLEVHSVDFFWHLVSGRWMLTHGALLRHDPFRFTSRGVAWVDHEWGFQLLLALVERAGGLPALVLLRAGFFLAVGALLLTALLRRGVPAAGATTVTLITLLGLRTRLLLRPELASLLAFTLLLLLLGRFRARGGKATAAALVALVALWANVHPGVLVAPVVTAAYLLGARLDPRRDRRRPGWRWVVALPAATALAILFNPWGVEVVLVPLHIARALAGIPLTNPDWAPLWREPQPLLLLGLGALALLLVAVRRRGGHLDAAGTLAMLALVPLVLTSARHQGMLWVAGALLAGEALADLEAVRGEPRRHRRLAAAAAALACLAAAAWCLLPAGPQVWRPQRSAGFGITPGRFPARTVDALASWEPVGNLYNSAVFGGYLLWRLYPPRQVFYDTRNEVNPALLREVLEGRSGSVAWEALLERYGIDAALVRYEDRLRPVYTAAAEPGRAAEVSHHTSSALLFPPERFALVYWDDVAMLFLARTPERKDRLTGGEYRFVQPEDWRATLHRAVADAAFRQGAVGELRRKLSEDPGCHRARELLRALSALPVAPPG